MMTLGNLYSNFVKDKKKSVAPSVPGNPLPPLQPRRSVLSQETLPYEVTQSTVANHQPSLTWGSLSLHNGLASRRDHWDSHREIEATVQHAQSEGSLLSLMSRRLYEVETMLTSFKERVIDLEEEISLKEARIDLLKQKLGDRDAGKEGAHAKNSSHVVVEREEYAKMLWRHESLVKTVQEMHKFLYDYGLTWVGEDGMDETNDEDFSVDFAKLLRNIEELNIYVKAGEGQLVFTNQGATFKMAESVPLTLFSNGLVMFSGPFRDYNDPSTRVFVEDILDGFFPSELQRTYPEGTPFKVIDKHEVVYQDPKRCPRVFGGTGRRLGSVVSTSAVADPESGAAETAESSDRSRFVREARTKRLEGWSSGHDPPTKEVSMVPPPSIPSLAIEEPVASKAAHKSVKPVKKLQTIKRGNEVPASVNPSLPVKRSSAHTDITEKTARGVAGVEKTREKKQLNRTANFTNMYGPNVKKINKLNSTTKTRIPDLIEDLQVHFESSFQKDSVIRKSISCMTASSNDQDGRTSCSNLARNSARGFGDDRNSGDKDVGEALRNRRTKPKQRVETKIAHKPMGVDEFLKKLPPVVVRDGKLIDIRREVSNVIQTPIPSGPTYRTIKFDDGHPRIHLKIRSHDGENVYLVQISPHRTVAGLRLGLGEMFKTKGTEWPKYHILHSANCSKWRALANNELTLQQSGITRNAVLCLQLATETTDNKPGRSDSTVT